MPEVQISIILPLQKKWISIIWIPTPGVRIHCHRQGPDGFCGGRRQSFFAGGYDFEKVSDRVDIYNFNTGKWDTARLSLPRCFASAAYVGSKVVIAGGVIASDTTTDRVDIYDTVTDTWTVSALSEPKGFIDNATAACNKAYFVVDVTLVFRQIWNTSLTGQWISMIPIQAPGRFNT
ncbi:MAG: hypothetical protein IPL08_15160 [Saprospiraceae bacterium]|nr:hypothetical protein [Saprospiraceae bacterium]